MGAFAKLLIDVSGSQFNYISSIHSYLKVNQSSATDQINWCESVYFSVESNELAGGRPGSAAQERISKDSLIDLLNNGKDVLILDFASLADRSTKEIHELLSDLPPQRLALSFTPDPANLSSGPNFNVFSELFDTFFIVEPPAIETIVQLKVSYPSCNWIIDLGKSQCSLDSILDLLQKGIDVSVHQDKLFIQAPATKNIPKTPLQTVDYVQLLLCHTKSDRPDGLYPTLVVDQLGKALGLCYSSNESISEAIAKKMGVYWSRERGLWYKGSTSGATQTLLGISLDCDADTLQFTVLQSDPGFCHLDTRTCFGRDQGISALYRLLKSRKSSDAPEKSYTKRLFASPELLSAKIREEAQELCDATTRQDVAWEAADLIYFALVKAVSEGVELEDIERNLDLKSKKVTRRAGDAKPEFQKPVLYSPAPVNGTKDENIQEKESTESTDLDSKKNAIVETPLYYMKVFHDSLLSNQEKETLLLRPIINTDEIMGQVRPIVQSVRLRGDEAIAEFTKKFDRVDLGGQIVLNAPFPESLRVIPEHVKKAIDLAYNNIEKFHNAQLENNVLEVETMPGVTCTRFCRPIERVGLYVPGGTAVLPSSALMLGVPAKVAGCSQIVIATPPRPDGSIVPEVVYVAHLVGASCIVKAGGAQAVAAMAYGTESVPKVDKICGPGNQYVTAAKMIAQSDSSALLGIDMPAGPSELLVIADQSADPRYVVSDLLSQAEHGVDSQVVLLTVGLDPVKLELYQKELVKQASVLPRRDIVKVSLSKSYILSMDTIQDAISFSNKYAPEHLILNVESAEEIVEKINNAGSVFVGPYSPESCGDYASGTNHTLPTYGYARIYSGVNTHTFLKHITSQRLTREGLDRIGDAVVTLAEIEGLEAHRNAVAIRLTDIRKA